MQNRVTSVLAISLEWQVNRQELRNMLRDLQVAE